MKKWEILANFKNKDLKLKTPDIVNILLKNRGIKTKKEKKEFFNPPPPDEITVKSLSLSAKDINRAINRIKKARKNKEKVIIYGDYDADGICGTAILWETLYSMDLDALPYIPERFTEGYGLNVESVIKLKRDDPKLGLIITVDHGIVAGRKVDEVKKLGVDVIITDHHVRGKKVPSAHSIIHTTKISGAGVAWVFAREILKQVKMNNPLRGENWKLKIRKCLDLCAIGTIADQLPLLGANRSFAKYGLEELGRSERLGLIELFCESGLNKGSTLPRPIGPYEVGFIIAPRINAMGRMVHAIDSLRLLCTKNPSQARELANLLGRTNLERQKTVDEVVLHAKSFVRGKGLIILAHESYHEGVIGLVASKLVEEFGRPAIVISKKGDVAKASARSISGFNIIEAIRKAQDLLLEGGGHPMAAGFSLETKKIQEFSVRLNEIAQPLLTEELLVRRLKIDMEIPFASLTKELFSKLALFEPTGGGNPAPIFATRGVSVIDAKKVGRERNHLKLNLESGDRFFGAIGFGLAQLFPNLSPGAKVDVAYSVINSVWNGEETWELKIKDVKLPDK